MIMYTLEKIPKYVFIQVPVIIKMYNFFKKFLNFRFLIIDFNFI